MLAQIHHACCCQAKQKKIKMKRKKYPKLNVVTVTVCPFHACSQQDDHGDTAHNSALGQPAQAGASGELGLPLSRERGS